MRPHPSFARVAAAALAAAALLPGGCARRPEEPAAQVPAPPTTPAAPARAADAGYSLRPPERDAVDRFLRENPGLRVATDEDRRPGADAEGVGALYAVYHPYFVRGDVNDDGLLDFVLAFVRRDSDLEAPWFSVAVFSGRPDGSFLPGAFLERDISLADGDLSVDRDAIVVTPDLGDEIARRYRWDPERRRHVFVRDEPDPAETPPLAQT